MKLPIIIGLLAIIGASNCEAGERIIAKARYARHIIVFAKHFDIDDRNQKPIGDTGRAIVIERGSTLKGWKLDEDCWRYHVGTGRNEWVGPVGKTIGNVTQIPGVGSLFTGIFGNWNRERATGAKSVDIEFKKTETSFSPPHRDFCDLIAAGQHGCAARPDKYGDVTSPSTNAPAVHPVHPVILA